MSKWKFCIIDDLKGKSKSSITVGPFGSRMKSDCYQDDGVPVIRGNNISDLPGFFGEFVFVSEEKASELESSKVYLGDLVFPHRGNIGEVGIVAQSQYEKYLMSTSLMKLTCNQDLVNPYFLYYFFKSPIGRKKLLQNASQVGTPGIATPLTSLKNIEVFLPSPEEQKAIAAVLSCLDRKIENLRKQNETLEAIAQTLFKRWFIDFEFPYDFTQGKPSPDGQPYKSSGGVMHPSELGEIPEGWRVGQLEEIVSVNPRESIKKGAKTKYVEMKALSTSGMEITDSYSRDFTSGSKFRNQDTLLARITPCLENGKTAFVNILDDGEIGYGSTEFIVMRATQESCPEFVYLLARNAHFRSHVIKNMTGSSGRQRVPNEQVSLYEIPIPQQGVMNIFHEITNPGFEKIAQSQKAVQSLIKIRDTLLPKLMSGKLRITP